MTILAQVHMTIAEILVFIEQRKLFRFTTFSAGFLSHNVLSPMVYRGSHNCPSTENGEPPLVPTATKEALYL